MIRFNFESVCGTSLMLLFRTWWWYLKSIRRGVADTDDVRN